MELEVNEVKGLAQNLLTDRQSATFDAGKITSARESTAKGRLEDVLLTEGKLAQHVDDAGGPDAMLNDLANESTLSSRLQRGFALAFLEQFADDDAVIAGGRTTERTERFDTQLKGWARGFGPIAAHTIGYTTTTSTAGGGAFAGTLSTSTH